MLFQGSYLCLRVSVSFLGIRTTFVPFNWGILVVATIVVLVATGVAILSWARKAPQRPDWTVRKPRDSGHVNPPFHASLQFLS